MTTDAVALAAPASRGRRGVDDLRRDERGAILVLGIFMCACMVGALWYLAGIGSAIVYRERMQEGADAVAFSGAVLHARGMNLIVLLNFVMAAILAIRVALRVAQVALVIVGTIISLIPFGGAVAAQPFFQTASWLETGPISTTRPLINNALTALSRVQLAIARIVPPAALVGSYQVGEKFAPVIETSAAGSPLSIRDGLPVAEDTADKLCRKAGEAVGSVFAMAVPIGDLAEAIEGMMGRLAQAGGAFFCEIGTGGGPPDVSQDLNQGAEDACDQERDRLVGEANTARQNYDTACANYNCTTSTPTQAQQQELDGLALERDMKQQAVDDFDRDRCVDEKRQEARDTFNQRTGGGSNPPAGSGQGMTPKKVRDGWKNGIRDAQVLAVATGNLDSLRAAETGARSGAWATPVEFRVPASASFSLAQAEYFFDCRGPWTGSDCEGEHEAMWRFRWRARLRRYNAPFEGMTQISNVLVGAEALQSLMGGVGAVGFQNADLFGELAQVAGRGELIIH
jgi:hypothetical protein